MSLNRLARQAGEVWEVPRDLLLRRYPPFVTGGPLPRGHVPVFVFHGLEPDSFGRKLQYLADNGYRTLTAQEYMDVLAGSTAAPERAVVLTFDDGRASLATVGAPLLERHGMTGVVFLVPGRTPARAPSTGAQASDTALLSWEQIESLAASGTFDFQSHTLHHARIHVAPRVAGFMTPWMRHGYPAFDVPLVERGGRDLLAPDVPLGTPLLQSAPRTSEALRFHEDASPRQPCIEAVASAGGEAFFARPRWERPAESTRRSPGITTGLTRSKRRPFKRGPKVISNRPATTMPRSPRAFAGTSPSRSKSCSPPSRRSPACRLLRVPRRSCVRSTAKSRF